MTIIANAPLHKRLKFARELANLEQTQLADKVGVSRATLSAFENGHREPSFSQVVAWAALTGQELSWLAEGVRLEGFEPPTV